MNMDADHVPGISCKTKNTEGQKVVDVASVARPLDEFVLRW